MRVYIENDKIVASLASRFTRKMKELGEAMTRTRAKEIIARGLGFRNYDSLRSTYGYADRSSPDQYVEPAEQARRYTQYLGAMLDSGIPHYAAVLVLRECGVCGFWKFNDLENG